MHEIIFGFLQRVYAVGAYQKQIHKNLNKFSWYRYSEHDKYEKVSTKSTKMFEFSSSLGVMIT